MSTVNERYIARIDKALAQPGDKAKYGLDDTNVLRYIRSQLKPEGLELRAADAELPGDTDVSHLHAVANQRLAPYEKEQTTTDE